jgi:hypothetical protein
VGFIFPTSKIPPLTDLKLIRAGKEFGCGFDSKPSNILRAKTIYCKLRCGASFKIKQEKNEKIIITIKFFVEIKNCIFIL